MLKNLALMLCMLLTTSSFAQKYTVKGSVSDANTRDPLADVNISIVGESGGGITNSQGNFQIKVENLPALLYFSHMAYAIEQVEVNKTNKRNMEVFLFPEIQDLEEVTISAERVQKVSLGDTLNVIDYAVVVTEFFWLPLLTETSWINDSI